MKLTHTLLGTAAALALIGGSIFTLARATSDDPKPDVPGSIRALLDIPVLTQDVHRKGIKMANMSNNLLQLYAIPSVPQATGLVRPNKIGSV